MRNIRKFLAMKNQYNRNKAVKIRDRFDKIIKPVRIKARNGDVKCALKVLDLLVEKIEAVRKTGFEMSFHNNQIVTRATYLRQSRKFRIANAKLLTNK